MAKSTDDLETMLMDNENMADTGVLPTLNEMASLARETLDVFRFLVSGSADGHVFFADVGSENRVHGLAASPVDVSAQLGSIIEDSNESVVLTSATLSVGGDFQYLLNRFGVGSSPRVSTERYESPFDLERRRVVLPTYLPDPGSVDYADAAAEVIRTAHDAIPRRFVVLCTSRFQLRQLSTALGKYPGQAESLYPQLDGTARGDLLERYKKDPKGILLGLASFWEGVDLPGDLVEVVVITKLPFMVPADPIVQARSHRVSAVGESPFEKLYLPDVVLKLRQGMGRLIRTGTDRGAVILLDRRLKDSPYGGFVMDAVAPFGHTCAENHLAVVEQTAAAFLTTP